MTATAAVGPAEPTAVVAERAVVDKAATVVAVIAVGAVANTGVAPQTAAVGLAGPTVVAEEVMLAEARAEVMLAEARAVVNKAAPPAASMAPAAAA